MIFLSVILIFGLAGKPVSAELSNIENIVNLLYNGLKQEKLTNPNIDKAVQRFSYHIDIHYKKALLALNPEKDRLWILLANRFMNKEIPEKFASNKDDDRISYSEIRIYTSTLWPLLPADVRTEIMFRVDTQMKNEFARIRQKSEARNKENSSPSMAPQPDNANNAPQQQQDWLKSINSNSNAGLVPKSSQQSDPSDGPATQPKSQAVVAQIQQLIKLLSKMESTEMPAHYHYDENQKF